MKTYFMAWESDNKRGHSIYDFDDDEPPRQALKTMLDSVRAEFINDEIPLVGVISANQFNRVD